MAFAYLIMAIVSVFLVNWETLEDTSSISEGLGDDHTRDVIEAILHTVLIGLILSFTTTWAFMALPIVYAGYRVLLFDFILNKRMCWPPNHFRDNGFDKIFFGKPMWYVWLVKGSLFALSHFVAALIFVQCFN